VPSQNLQSKLKEHRIKAVVYKIRKNRYPYVVVHIRDLDILVSEYLQVLVALAYSASTAVHLEESVRIAGLVATLL
jgi:hypothetical protein